MDVIVSVDPNLVSLMSLHMAVPTVEFNVIKNVDSLNSSQISYILIQ